MRTRPHIARALLLFCLIVSVAAGCSRRSEPRPIAQQPSPPETNPVSTAPVARSDDRATAATPSPKHVTRTTYASWYDVPGDSLAAKRAAPGELTAAHDRYHIGTRLRVTNVENGRSVVVRVTDRGVPRGKAPLDLCKRAAEELDMLRQGTARVKVDVLPEEELAAAAPGDSPSAPAQP